MGAPSWELRQLCAALVMLLTAACASSEPEDPRIEAARDLFERFVDLGNRYDTSIADLYADDARIVLTGQNPDEKREVTIPGREFKELVREMLPAAREAGEQNIYVDVTYWIEGDLVRIEATRRTSPSNSQAQHQMLVGPNENGTWLIREELAVSPL